MSHYPKQSVARGRSSVAATAVLSLAAGLVLSLSSFVAAAQETWPARPVRIVVPYGAGGSLDLTVRRVAQRLSEMWKQPVLVENRPGGSGVLGTEIVLKAPPDGHVLGGGASPIHTANKLLIAKLSYDPDRDITPIALLARNPLFLVVHPSVPANTLPEFIAYAKANPNKISYASVGLGSPQHVSFETLKARGGFEALHVPYKAASAAMQDLVGGQINAIIDTTAMQQVRSGKLKAIAVAGDERFVGEPSLPAFGESGMRGFEFSGWFSLFGPRGMSPALVERINADTNRVLASPELRAKLLEVFTVAVGGTQQEFIDFIKRQMTMLSAAYQAAGIKPE
jgi:tripartite-type tricarboxylate transporter receptor subunit TctC